MNADVYGPLTQSLKTRIFL